MASGFATLANWRGFLGATHGLAEFFHLDVLGDIAQELRAFCCRLGNDLIPLVLGNGRQHAGLGLVMASATCALLIIATSSGSWIFHSGAYSTWRAL